MDKAAYWAGLGHDDGWGPCEKLAGLGCGFLGCIGEGMGEL